jgi:hypothetical protein
VVDIAVRDQQMRIKPLDHFSEGIRVHRIPKTIARKRVLAFPYDDAIALPSCALNQRNVRGDAGNSSFAQCGTVEEMGGQCNSPEKTKPPGGFRTRDAYSPDSSFMETSRLAVHRSSGAIDLP